MSNEKYKGVEPTKSTVNLSHEALGTFKDSETGEWQVAVFKYDPVTGKTGEFTKIPCGGKSKDFATEQFKIEAYERGLAG